MTLLLVALLSMQEPVAVRMQAFAGLPEEGLQIGCMTMTSGWMLFGDDAFGGYSGLRFDPASGGFTLLSDAAHILVGTLALDGSGRITGLSGTPRRYPIEGALIAPLKDEGGRRRGGDTESLERFGDDWLVTREGDDDAVRVALASDGAVMTGPLADLSAGGPLGRNGGYEAAAHLGGGRYVFIAETKDARETAPILVWDGETTRLAGRYQGIADFEVTDAAVDAAGRSLYVVERAFSRTLGPRARVTVLPVTDVLYADGMVLQPEELGRLGFLEGADNMEALDVFDAADGSRQLVLVSDDNFNELQRTVLVTLRIGPSCPGFHGAVAGGANDR